jgi:hypothetical protein
MRAMQDAFRFLPMGHCWDLEVESFLAQQQYLGLGLDRPKTFDDLQVL